MPAKDFYKILNVPITASQGEIKKAYRLLALKYHPDVNPGGKATETWFREIHEAYRVLGDPDRRSVYNQDRWYRESTISSRMDPPRTPEEMLLRSRKLLRLTETLDSDRTDFQALEQYILYLLSDDNLRMLSQWNNAPANLEILNVLLSASAMLTYKKFTRIAEKLLSLVPNGDSLITEALKKKKQATYWKNYQFLVVILIAILLCLLIYFAGR